MEEITLLEAMHRLRNHKKKSVRLVFLVTFDDCDRKTRFGKKWNKVMKEWQYLVQDSEHAPTFCYDERAAVSAITSVPGMGRYFATVKYHVYQEEPEVAI